MKNIYFYLVAKSYWEEVVGRYNKTFKIKLYIINLFFYF